MFESKLKLIFWNENWGGLPRYLAFKKSMGAKNSLFFVTKIAFFTMHDVVGIEKIKLKGL